MNNEEQLELFEQPEDKSEAWESEEDILGGEEDIFNPPSDEELPKEEVVAPIEETPQGEEVLEPQVNTETPVNSDPLSEAQSTIAELRQQIEALMNKQNTPATQAPEAPANNTPIVQSQEGVFDFIGDEDIDDVVSTKEKFNQAMTRVVNLTAQTIVRNLPSMVQTQVATHSSLREATESFYKENEDLLPVRKTVGNVADQVAAEHPDWTIPQLFEETANRTRKILGIKRSTTTPVNSPSSTVRPALPNSQKSGRRGATTPLDPQQKQILDIIL